MTGPELKALTIEGFEQMFNNGNLDYVDGAIHAGGTDHQEVAGTEFAEHLKEVITALRGGFPDLRFEVQEILCEGSTVACRSTMHGTHRGRLNFGPLAQLEPTNATVAVPHMHFFHYEQGQVTDLWHVWDTPALARQLGLPVPDFKPSA